MRCKVRSSWEGEGRGGKERKGEGREERKRGREVSFHPLPASQVESRKIEVGGDWVGGGV